MAITDKAIDKWVRDPLFSIVKRFLNERLKIVREEGDLTDRILAEDRYLGMSPNDFIIESVLTGPDGVKRVCLVNKTRHFARVDMPVSGDKITLKEVLYDQDVNFVIVLNKDDFIDKFKKGQVQNKMLYLAWRNTYGFCVKNEDALDMKVISSLMKDIFFEHMSLERVDETTIDPETLTSGTVTLKDDVIPDSLLHVFIIENIMEELGIGKIKVEMATSYGGTRGGVIRAPITLTLNEQDITAAATITFTSPNHRIHFDRSTNKLECIFSIIRGSRTTILTENAVMQISYNGPEGVAVKDVPLVFTIHKDMVTEMTIHGHPVTMDVPSGMKMGIVVTGMISTEYIKFTLIPGTLRSMIYGINLNRKGDYSGGPLFVGPVSAVPPADGRLYDLVTGMFSHEKDGKITYGQVFIEIDIVQPRTQYTGLDELNIFKGVLIGQKDRGKVYAYSVSAEGVEVPGDSLVYDLGAMGSQGIANMLGPASNKTNIVGFVKEGSAPGLAVEETVQVRVGYPKNGLYYERVDPLTLKCFKPSDVQLVRVALPLVNLKKYDTAPLPFMVIVNGVNVTATVGHGVTEATNQVRRPVGYTIGPEFACQVLNVIGEGGKVKAVYNVDMMVDGAMNRYSFDQEYMLEKWTGNDTVFVPDTVAVKGKTGTSGKITGRMYYKDVLAGQTPALTAESTFIPGFAISPIQGSGNVTTINYYFTGTGSSGRSVLKIARKANPDPLDIATLNVDAIIIPVDGFSDVIAGETTVKTMKSTQVLYALEYDGVPVPVNDPRVTLTMVPPAEYVDKLSISTTNTTGFTVYVNMTVPVGETVPVGVTIELDFRPDGNTVIRRTRSTLLKIVAE